jgi:hypothetical protein
MVSNRALTPSIVLAESGTQHCDDSILKKRWMPMFHWIKMVPVVGFELLPPPFMDNGEVV